MYILCIFLIFYFRIPLNHITIRHSIGNIKHGVNKNLISREETKSSHRPKKRDPSIPKRILYRNRSMPRVVTLQARKWPRAFI